MMLTSPLFHPVRNRPLIASLWLIGLTLLWHLFLAGQVNLSVDEAHYALYGAKPDWSYFDHPPMVGWLNALVVPFSHSDTALRVMPALLFALSNYLLYHIAIRLFPTFEWVGFWTLALINSAFMFQLLSISMLPDTPLMVASLLVFWALLNLRESRLNSPESFQAWIAIGFWLGLAGLSKYTSVTLVLSLLLVMVVEKHWYWLKDRGLYAALLIALILISPVLLWNQQHDWISFLYQIHHGTHNDDWDWQRVINTQLAQLGLYSLALYGIGLWLMVTRLFKNNGDAIRLLALFGLPVILLFAMNSGYEMSLPHWTQLAWLFIAPAVAFHIWQHWSKKAMRVFVYISTTITLVASLLLNSQLATPWMPLPDNENIVRELHGWPEAMQTAQQLKGDSPLVASNWTQASRMAWYAYPEPVYVTDNRYDQFDMWFGNPPAGSDGLLVVPSYEDIPPKTTRPGYFSNCVLLQKLPIKNNKESDATIIVTYSFYQCQNFIPVQYSGWVTELPLVQQNEKTK